ncbi:MAG: hypothetical protein MUF33_09775 [Candidatus Nanopelagicales bacterium]|jgi:hypothetical protein|nr:hypothetical protein [Candidatus Nanopelagicales bacterium]MCU0294437.1 hypothetical protein [Candidatus Nanopelagicales bacterium]MCU0298790.1 hypothetical protein [Candidatus Nanopelagicales bacterium]
MLTKTLIAGTAGLALAIPMTPALAKDGDNRVEVFSGGQCSSSARWELKVKERDGGVEVEFEVDSNVVGQDWDYTLTGPNGVLSQGTRTTTGPSGSFSVEVDTAGAATDSFKGVATHDGQICDSTVNVGVGDDSGSDDGPGDDKGGNRSRQTFEGSCTDGAEITLKVKRSAVFRIAELEVDSDVKGQKWSYEIRRGDKTIASGNARTKGRSGSFSVKTKARGKGQLTASASRAGGSEDCSID